MSEIINYTALADSLGVSKSTVSKVLRHCGGVDSETRNRILRAAGSISPAPFREHTRSDVYVILPDTPSFFWQTLLRAVSDEAERLELPTKCNVYTRLTDTETVMTYLDEAEALDARVVILATVTTDALRERLTHMAKDRLILLLSERDEAVNTFYVGADAYADGAAMGRAWLSACPDTRLVVLTTESNANLRTRVQGLTDTLAAAGAAPYCLRRIPVEELGDRKTFPSHLAGVIDAVLPPGRENVSLYVPFGFAQLARAADKAGLGSRTVCLTHDYLASHDRIGSRTRFRVISCDQDLLSQGRTAARLAANYLRSGGQCPDSKHIFLPSSVVSAR